MHDDRYKGCMATFVVIPARAAPWRYATSRRCTVNRPVHRVYDYKQVGKQLYSVNHAATPPRHHQWYTQGWVIGDRWSTDWRCTRPTRVNNTYIKIRALVLAPLCVPYTPTKEALKHVPCLIGSHRVACHPHVLYPQGQSHTWYNLHPQSSTAVTRCLLVAKHITDPEKIAWVTQTHARECRVRELNPGRCRQRRVRYHPATCFHSLHSLASPSSSVFHKVKVDRLPHGRPNIICSVPTTKYDERCQIIFPCIGSGQQYAHRQETIDITVLSPRGVCCESRTIQWEWTFTYSVLYFVKHYQPSCT